MIGNLKGEHDSICRITSDFYSMKVVFNRDVEYLIDTQTLIIEDMEGISDVDKRDLELMKKVISPDIKTI